ncbi:hypothetical protein OTU49_006920 [Cherax quadricarinatus]|uniref:Uncharacterized protein n=1 Tax=Cherax quadricarinatus TaxID=27406 RepID=A0AAW0WZC0_CHEQU
MEVEESLSEKVEGEDGFSFHPQREKRSTRPELTPPKFFRHQRKRQHQDNKRSRGFLAQDGNKFPLLDFIDHIQAQVAVEEHFSKHFTFKKMSEMGGNDAWKLPAAETMYTQSTWQSFVFPRMKSSRL